MKIKLIINMEIIYGKIVKVRIQNGSVIYHFIKIKNIKSKAIETGRHYTYGVGIYFNPNNSTAVNKQYLKIFENPVNLKLFSKLEIN